MPTTHETPQLTLFRNGHAKLSDKARRAPSGGARPGQVVGRVVEVRPARVVPSGPANTQALLSIAYPNTCTLFKPLLSALNLTGMGSTRFHIVVPTQLGGAWYLDTNPKPGVGARLPERGCARFRIQQVPKMHFGRRQPLFAPGGGALASMRGNTNVFVKQLYFELGPEVTGYPGYYCLLPVTRAVHH